MIRVETKRDFKNTDIFLKKCADNNRIMPILEKYGARGVELLRQATPVDSSKTATSWNYIIDVNKKGKYNIRFSNSNVIDGVNIAIILQYGHGTRNGGYVKGVDYINPVLKKAFEEMRNELIKEVGRK